MSSETTRWAGALWAAGVMALTPSAPGAEPVNRYLSPSALAATSDGKTLFVACATAGKVLVFDTASGQVTQSIPLPQAPSGLALGPGGRVLYVTCAAPVSQLCVVDVAKGGVSAALAAGHTAMGPALSPDGKTLYLCHRYNDEIAFLDLETGQIVQRVAVPREPVAASVTPDGRLLFVANHLPVGRGDADVVAASVSVLDLGSGRLIQEIVLPNGSTSLMDVRVSPDGKYAAVTHSLSRFHLPTTQLERGWMNTSALSLIDVAGRRLINTVLVDNVDSGAANPWGLAWAADSKRLCLTHAGTHELSVIEVPPLLERLAKMAAVTNAASTIYLYSASRTAADVPNDLAFLVGVRKRIKLEQQGPRAVVLLGAKAYTANYYADSLSVVDVVAEYARPKAIALGPKPEPTLVRKGEMFFHDATICFQGWQSCASCHPGDARVDGLNWDLLNDGMGNPKNTKSMLLAYETPPAMSMGVRETAMTATRAGIKHILFTVQPDEVALSMDAYLKALQPVPSPWLVNGQLSDAAKRGEKLFKSDAVGCAQCHPPTLFTDLKHYEAGTRGQFDKATDIFDTPSLVEAWRTAPYLHDGSAATMRDVLTRANKNDQHGKTSHLTKEQIEDLAAYVLSL